MLGRAQQTTSWVCGPRILEAAQGGSFFIFATLRRQWSSVGRPWCLAATDASAATSGTGEAVLQHTAAAPFADRSHQVRACAGEQKLGSMRIFGACSLQPRPSIGAVQLRLSCLCKHRANGTVDICERTF